MTAITTTVGRLVYGHPLKLQQKKDTKKQPVFKDGKPVMIRSFGVAYPKADFNVSLWPIMHAEALRVFPTGIPPHFAYKFKDGDSVDKQGKPYSAREGYAGCCVVHYETQFDLAAFRPNPQQPGAWDQIGENDFKTGDYIAVNVDITGNKPTDITHTPGLYVNPNGVLHIGNGTAIINAPSADQMFGGGTQYQLPPGAQPAGAPPQMPGGMATPPGMPYGAVGQPAAAPAYQQPPAYGQPAAAPAYQAAPEFVPGYNPQQQPAPGYGVPAGPQPGQAPGYGQPPQYGAPAQYGQPGAGVPVTYPSNQLGFPQR